MSRLCYDDVEIVIAAFQNSVKISNKYMYGLNTNNYRLLNEYSVLGPSSLVGI